MAKLIPWLFLLPPALVTIVALATVAWGRTPKGRALKHFRVGGDHVHHKRLEEAEAQFRAGLALWPDHGPMIGSLASLLVAQERFDDAEPLLAQALKIDPGDTRLRLLQGRCRQGLDDREGALSLWGAIAEDSDVYPDAMALIADAHEREGDLDGALEHVEKAIAKSSVHQARPYKRERTRLKKARDAQASQGAEA